MFEKILVATDGSAAAGRAIDVAGNLSSKYGSEVLVAHVIMHGHVPDSFRHMAEVEHLIERTPGASTPTSTMPAGMAPTIKYQYDKYSSMEIFQALGETILKKAESAAKAAGAVSVKTILLEGDTADAILQAAKDQSVDTLVVGTRGLSEIKGLLMGSVSHKILQLAPCACVTVK